MRARRRMLVPGLGSPRRPTTCGGNVGIPTMSAAKRVASICSVRASVRRSSDPEHLFAMGSSEFQASRLRLITDFETGCIRPMLLRASRSSQRRPTTLRWVPSTRVPCAPRGQGLCSECGRRDIRRGPRFGIRQLIAAGGTPPILVSSLRLICGSGRLAEWVGL